MDLAASLPSADRVDVLLGDGKGSFRLAPSVPVPDPQSLVLADVNGDAAADVVAVCAADSRICIRLGDGRGGFSGGSDISVDSGLLKLVTADLDRDGRPDLIVAGSGSQSVTALLGDGRGGLTTSAIRTLGSPPQGLTVADLNADGLLDVAAVRTGGIEVMTGDGRGGLTAPQLAGLSSQGERRLAAADFDEDGRTDLITWSLDNDVLRLYVRDVGGHFSRNLPLVPETGPTACPSWI